MLVTTYLIDVTLCNSSTTTQQYLELLIKGNTMNARDYHAKQLHIIKTTVMDAWADPVIDDIFNTDIHEMSTEQLIKIVERDVLEFKNDYKQWSDTNVRS